MSYYEEHYSQLVGKRITSMCRDSDSEDDPIFGLIIDREKVAWIMRDEEGNGPGHLYIEDLNIHLDKEYKEYEENRENLIICVAESIMSQCGDSDVDHMICDLIKDGLSKWSDKELMGWLKAPYMEDEG